MKFLSDQRGVGLVEVLVAVLLLSIAVLGFSALQMRAITATDESLVRTKSLTVIRNLAEVMRAYPEAYVIASGTSFNDAAPTDIGAEPTVQAVVGSSATETATVGGEVISILASGNNCLSTEMVTTGGDKKPKQPCSINQLAARDALMIKKMAADEDIDIAVTMCPGTSAQAIQQQMCVITAWNDTKALLDDSDAKACADSSGVYKTGSQCLISEAY
ncbi:type IV pilus modification protein PilV [Psychrobacter sp. NPDC078631]|uniref:type IV pilus modification protein PilV n=1 Tax=Psychrobacter sp. NPDC078631 TaxID=3390666 RepID=UPI003D04A274